jgi:hypothetical protein
MGSVNSEIFCPFEKLHQTKGNHGEYQSPGCDGRPGPKQCRIKQVGAQLRVKPLNPLPGESEAGLTACWDCV